MSAIDHLAEAEKIAVEIVNGRPDRRGYLAEAQLHATLYAAEQTAELVKQQRIANMQVERELLGQKFGRAFSTVALNAHEDANDLNTIIREGLGLS